MRRADLGRIVGPLGTICFPGILLEHKGKLPWCDTLRTAVPTVEIGRGVGG